jgi:hypothetical protein
MLIVRQSSLIVTLRFDTTEIDPKALQLDSYDVGLGSFDGLPATLEIVEWKRNVGRSLFLCTEDGTTFDELKAGIRAPDFSFCGYARWSGFTAADDSALNELDSGPAGAVIEASRDAMRTHFRGRRDERNRAVIGRWKADLVYPTMRNPSIRSSLRRARTSLRSETRCTLWVSAPTGSISTTD